MRLRTLREGGSVQGAPRAELRPAFAPTFFEHDNGYCGFACWDMLAQIVVQYARQSLSLISAPPWFETASGASQVFSIQSASNGVGVPARWSTSF